MSAFTYSTCFLTKRRGCPTRFTHIVAARTTIDNLINRLNMTVINFCRGFSYSIKKKRKERKRYSLIDTERLIETKQKKIYCHLTFPLTFRNAMNVNT